jgi:8-oxo-dGTP pyrophosphatase MutT (NUDIX family)
VLPSRSAMEHPPPVTVEILNDGPPTIPRQAASVILLRASHLGFELLLVKRSPAQRFMGGYWVFPGGAVDADEGEGEAAQRAAAVRELREEAGVAGIAAADLVRYSRWITPELLRIRFDTHFFLALTPAGTVARCDGHECVDQRWDAPQALLDDYARGTLALAFPTLRQIEQLAAFGSAAELLERARTHDVTAVLPRVVRSGEIARLVLPGEPGYDPAPPPPGDV